MYLKKNINRFLFYILGFFIVLGTLFYTNHLFSALAKEEGLKVHLFAEALKNVKTTEDAELNLYWEILKINQNIPILVFDQKDKLVEHKNITLKPQEERLSKARLIEEKGMHEEPISIVLDKNNRLFVYYGYSPTLYNLRYVPFVQLFFILLLIIVGYVLYKGIKISQHNSVWARLSKETAHQLGTPISSLIAWLELMQAKDIAPDYVPEMEKDVKRLEIVSNRFSLIGSTPIRKKQDLIPLIEEIITYMNSRTSKTIDIRLGTHPKTSLAEVNKELFVWVLENLIKNAVDAIVKEGTITISTFEDEQKHYIDVTDTGSGIPLNLFKKIFRPGYSSKKRGWGFGLPLAKRIIEDFHNGRIFVQNSGIEGTIFRIIIPKK